MKFLTNSVFAVATALLLSSCNIMDDQTIVTPERDYLGNPAPLKRDFARINSQHKILVGIIDTGVDYNHPRLAENIHFELSEKSSWPTSFGYDVSAQDKWASPYIVRTSDYNPEILAEERAKSVKDAQNIQLLITENPDFARFLNPLRNVGQEIQTSAYHGTHVAGLAAYDLPEVGILGYRVLPFSTKFKNGEPVPMDQGEVFVNQIIEGSQKAVADGARVLNMSLGMFNEKDYNDMEKSKVSEEAHKARIQKIREFALANPNVVVVVAAGNEGKWIDQDARLGMPCGTEAPNILCVGATEENGKIASFSNILMTEGAFIFGYGVNVLSTMPEGMCASRAVSGLMDTTEAFKTEKSKQKLVAELKKDCNDLGLKRLSGTSMASPIIARQVAKILLENPSLNGAEAIQALLAKANTYKIGKTEYPVLKVERPSWYPVDARHLGLRTVDEEEFFDFIVPKAQ